MLETLHARLQHYTNQELPDVQAGFKKGRGTRDQIANISWIIEKAREFQKIIYLCFIDYAKTITNCVKLLKRWEYQTILPVSLETCSMQVSNCCFLYGTTDWFKIGKGVWQGCLFNLYTEHIMWNSRLNESQAGIKIAGRKSNNLRYAEDTALIAESEEELKNLLKRVKEESEKASLKLSI